LERVAVLRCDIVSEVCPGSGCLKAWNARRVHFKDTPEDAELIGFFTCGGCSGRRVSRLVKSLLKSNLTTVHLSSCMLMDKEYPKCPHLDEIKKTLTNLGVKIVEGTHH
jgi:predicted metal-binding protein